MYAIRSYYGAFYLDVNLFQHIQNLVVHVFTCITQFLIQNGCRSTETEAAQSEDFSSGSNQPLESHGKTGGHTEGGNTGRKYSFLIGSILITEETFRRSGYNLA